MSLTIGTTRILALSAAAALNPAVFGQAQIVAIVNVASFQPGLPRGGALATLYVSGLNVQPGLYVASSVPLPFLLDGVSVVIDGLAFAPILAVSAPQSGNAQINFQVPLERNVSLPSATPSSSGSISVLVNLNVVASRTPLPAPMGGGFFTDQNGNVVAQHASDYSPVTQNVLLLASLYSLSR